MMMRGEVAASPFAGNDAFPLTYERRSLVMDHSVPSTPFSVAQTETVITETRLQRLIRTGGAAARFLQGVYPFAGRGVFDLGPLHDDLCYTVPPGAAAEVVYVRAGNLSDDILYLALSVNGSPHPLLPGRAEGGLSRPPRHRRDLPAGSRIEVCLAAPRGLTGTIVVDVGIVEMRLTP